MQQGQLGQIICALSLTQVPTKTQNRRRNFLDNNFANFSQVLQVVAKGKGEARAPETGPGDGAKMPNVDVDVNVAADADANANAKLQ